MRERTREILLRERPCHVWLASRGPDGPGSSWATYRHLLKQRTVDDTGRRLYLNSYLQSKRWAYRFSRRARRESDPSRAAMFAKFARQMRSCTSMYERLGAGSSFLMASRSSTLQAADVSLSAGVYRFDGSIAPGIGDSLLAELVPTSQYNLDIIGARVVREVRPTAPQANASQMVLELREGIPKMIGAAVAVRGLSARSIADEHLNYQFGISPLVSDLNDLVSAFEHCDRRWSQLARDSGKRVRRRRDLGVTSGPVTRTVNTSYGQPSLITYHYTDFAPGTQTVVKTSSTHRWFSGAFKYYLPDSADPFGPYRREAARWRTQYGVEMTLSTVYDLAPWTWLLEWFGGFSNAINNCVALSQDDQVMEYGYLMEHKLAEEDHDLVLSLVGHGPYRTRVVRQAETKYRLPANPYGFGIVDADLNKRQLSILAALGISRGLP